MLKNYKDENNLEQTLLNKIELLINKNDSNIYKIKQNKIINDNQR